MPLINADTATAADFEVAAQKHAHAAWVFGIIAALIWWFGGDWWTAIPGGLALVSLVSSLDCTRNASLIRRGRFRLSNINNGAPDGDAKNLS